MASSEASKVMKDTAKELTENAEKLGFSTFSKEAIAEAHSYVERFGMGSLKTYMEGKLNEWKDVKVKIAITGQSGAGKSSFINKMRNLKPGQSGAAPVGVTETTRKPTCYAHPDNENIELWDLPGVGTPNFPQSTYLKSVGFETFDCFIILSESRFTENDHWLASSVLNGGKRFYFLRTKIDNALRDDKEDKGTKFNEIETLVSMLKDCETNLAKIGSAGVAGERMKVYLVTNRDSKKFDFPKLLKHVLEELPGIKREVMVRALSHTSKEIVLKKKEVLSEKLWILAAYSALGGAVPIPGLSIVVDLAILVDAANDQKKVLGVDENSLKTIAESNGMTLDNLIKSLKIDISLMTNPLTWLKEMFSLFAIGTATEEVTKYVPIFGSLCAGGISAATTYYIAGQMLEKHVDIAIRCLEITAERAADDLD